MRDRLKSKAIKFVTQAIRASRYPARLGDGNGNLYVVRPDNTQRLNYVWARVQLTTGSVGMQILCTKVTPAYGASVWVELNQDHEWEAITTDTKEIEGYFEGLGSGNVPAHNGMHSYLGPDAIRVQGLQFEPLLTYPTIPMSLSVNIAKYVPDGFEGDALDLTPHVPTNDEEQRIVITGINTDDNTVMAMPGAIEITPTISPSDVPFILEDIQNVVLPDNFRPSAAVRLYYGQTQITLIDIFEDCRHYLNNETGGSEAQEIPEGEPAQELTTTDDATTAVISTYTQRHILTTTDATETTVTSIPLADGETVYLAITFIARCTGGTSGDTAYAGTYPVGAGFVNDGGVVTELPPPAAALDTHQHLSVTWSGTAEVGSGAVDIKVTGAADMDITWAVIIDVKLLAL